MFYHDACSFILVEMSIKQNSCSGKYHAPSSLWLKRGSRFHSLFSAW